MTYRTLTSPSSDFLSVKISRNFLLANVILSVVYLAALLFLFQRDNIVLYVLLMAGECFHVWQILTYIYTIWDTGYRAAPDAAAAYAPAVDVFITVAGEPEEIVEQTARA